MPVRNHIRLALLFATTSFPGHLHAQDTDLEDIVITGARTELPATALPLTVDVLAGEEYDDQIALSGSTVDALSARYPSFSPTREKLSGFGESLRGRSPLYAINGVPQSTPIRDGSRDGYTIDPFFIDRVEVIYGSNALQGIGATGGVVNQVTLGATRADGFSGQGLVQVTAQDRLDATIGAKGAALVGYRSGRFDMAAGAAAERRGVFIDGDGRNIGVDGTQGEIQDSDSWSLFSRLGYDLGGEARIDLVANRFSLEGRGNYVLVSGDRDAGIPASSERGTIEGAPPSNRADLVSLALTDGDLGGGSFSLQGFFSRTRDIFGGGVFGTFQDPAIDATGQLFDQSANRSRKLGARVGYERTVPGLDALTIGTGVDYLSDRTAQSLLATGRTWVPESTYRSIAPFAQANLAVAGDRLRLVGGVRYEDVTLDVPDFTSLASYGSRDVAGGSPSFDETLFNVGAVGEPMEGLRAYGSYSQGYTIADVGRILRGIDSDGVDVDDFLALEPVLSDNREVGLEWDRGRVRANLAYWWSSSDFGSRLQRNADGIFDVVREPIELEGLDASLETDLPVDGLSAGIAYAMVDGRTDPDGDGNFDTDLDGANIAPDRLNLHADYSRGRLDARLAARLYFERSFAGQDPANDFEGYTLLDAQVGYRIGKHRVLAGISNLLDRQYVTYISDTQSPTDDNRYFAGRGRTFTLGLTSSF